MSGIQKVNENNSFPFIANNVWKVKSISDFQWYFFAAIAVGKVLNIFLTFKISSQTMLFINFLSMILGNCIIMKSVNYSPGIYVGCCLLGYGISNCFPMMIVFADELITINFKIMSLIQLSTDILFIISSDLLDHFLKKILSYIGLNIATISIAFGIYILLLVLEKLRMKNHLLSERNPENA